MKSSFLETIKSIDGKVYNISYHQKRYEGVLKSLGTSTYRDISSYLNPPTDGLYRCRVVYSVETLHVTYHKYEKRDIKSLKLVVDDKIEYRLKSTCRDEIDNLFKLKQDCDDILIVKNSFISDTSIANIALYKDETWFTPISPLLAGTTRERLLSEGKIVEKKIHVDEIFSYSKVALLNAMVDFDIIQEQNIRKIIC